MSKQYLTAHSIENAHLADIFAIAVTPKTVLSASGASSIAIHDTSKPDFPLLQTLKNAHPTGCHHLATSRDGRVAASASFSGDLKVWRCDGDTLEWKLMTAFAVPGTPESGTTGKGTGIWAVALSEDGGYMAATTMDSRAFVWRARDGVMEVLHMFDGFNDSFANCVAISGNGKFLATGHQNGSSYVFDTETGRLKYSLSSLIRPIRAVAFSPGATLLAAAGDSNTIALYDVSHGEHVGNLGGHTAWITSIDWNSSGEYLVSASLNGRVKVWSIDRLDCVATHNETDDPLWAVRWLPKLGRNEYFVSGGAHRSLTFYREATGI